MSLMLLSLAALTIGDCAPLRGARAVVSSQTVRWLIVGESAHGTNEMPRAVADFVCAAVSERRPVVVAIEFRSMNQPFIDAYLRSDGGVVAREALLQAPAWDRGWADGKSSRAMFSLIDWLRVRHGRGQVLRVVAFDPDVASGNSDREAQMANVLRSIDPSPSGLVIALTGSFHARKRADAGDPGAYPPAASLLDRRRTISIRLNSNGGRFWGCKAAGCGVYKHEATRSSIRGLKVLTDRNGIYDGVLELGAPTTPSRPVKDD